jgi:tetratricopeptide (TPR) repeat protein
MNLNEALTDADKSIQNEERFENLMTKAQILDALGRKDEATSARNKALGIANAQQLYGYGRQLQREKRADEAFALFLSTAKKYPDFWLSHAGLARVYSSKGDFDNATKQMEMALAGAPDAAKTGVRGLIKRLQAKQDINQ